MSSGTSNILIVDDEPQVRDLTRRALAAQGFDCDTAGDGDEAYRLASTRNYDGVVTDLRMPRRHGHALCTDLLTLSPAPNILVLTALTDARLVRDLMSRGVHDVVQKPVDYDVLAVKVQAMIRHGRAARVAPKAPPKKKSIAKKANLLQKIEKSLIELTDIAGERLETMFDFEGELPDPPRSIQNYIRRLAESEVLGADRPVAVVLPGNESRQTERVTCYTTAVATPVDRLWNKVGEPFKLAVRDLSESGVRLLHTRATNAGYLALSWSATQVAAKPIRVVCQVRRCSPCGPFYDIGGQFVMAD